MSDLKPCPFCGFTDVEPYRSGDNNHYVECPRCGTFGPDCDSRQEAIDVWNTRADSATLAAAVQVEREACARIADVHRGCHAPKVYGFDLGADLTGRGIAEQIRSRGPAPAVDVMAVVREYVKSMTDLDPERGPRRYREARKALESLVLPNGEGRSCTCDHDHVEHDEHRPWCGGPHPTESVLDVVRRFLAAFDAHVASFPRGGVENAYDAIQFDKELTALRALVDGEGKGEGKP